jgi:hypothetical protein
MSEKRAHQSDNEEGNDDWFGPKQTEIENEQDYSETKIVEKQNNDYVLKTKKRKSIFSK